MPNRIVCSNCDHILLEGEFDMLKYYAKVPSKCPKCGRKFRFRSQKNFEPVEVSLIEMDGKPCRRILSKE